MLVCNQIFFINKVALARLYKHFLICKQTQRVRQVTEKKIIIKKKKKIGKQKYSI